MGEGGTWLCVPRTKIKTEMGRDGKGGFAISLSEVLGLVQPWELLPHHHQPRRWGWAPPLLWLSHSLWRGCQPCEMVHRHSFCTWECCYFTATQATEKVYFFVFFLMARNTPTEFGFKRGGEYSDRNTEGGREGAASRGWKLPWFTYLLQISNMAMKSMCAKRRSISCQVIKIWREIGTKCISLAVDLSFFKKREKNELFFFKC